MRCVTLADALKLHGVHVRFIARHMPVHLRDILDERGHEFILLNGVSSDEAPNDLPHAHWLGSSQHQDAIDSIQALLGDTWDWLVVDHYALDARWERAMRGVAKRILAIDDLADRMHDCDVLLDQNLYQDMNIRYINKVPAHSRLLLGPRYALLRIEFSQIREQVKPRTGSVNRVLIFMGGVDTDNYTGRAIEALVNMGIPGLEVDVVIGAEHPCREQIESRCDQHGFSCHVQTRRMAELMAAADLAIGAGGSASWERCCLGVPSLVVALADNQIDIATGLDLFGACVYIGSQEKASVPVLRKAIVDLLNCQGHLAALSENAYSLVDGRGVGRVCHSLGY